VICRICKSSQAKKIGEVQYYSAFRFEVLDCKECGSRFTPHLEHIYDTLHSNATSCYGLQVELACKAKAFFDNRDLTGLRRELCVSSKTRFIIESVDGCPKAARLLEVGCSRGYLTSYFILAGFDILGTDISKSVLDAARRDFGPFFADANSPGVSGRSPYDLIYHTGTIGCVSDPVEMTRSLLRMLKPQGKLIFNAPNVTACWLRGQPWIDFAPPPDVVTLYKPGFWTRFFSDEAFVTEVVENCQPQESMRIWLRRHSARWRPPRLAVLSNSLAYYKSGPTATPRPLGRARSLIEGKLGSVAYMLGVDSLVPAQPTPFGLFVTMTKK
jgi:SAM-dependent methyltransferase